MSSDQKIADIKRQLGETVSRIESIQGGQKQPLLTRISSHFRTQSGSLVNLVLTASIFAVAIGKLNQKQQHEIEKLNWQEKQLKIQLDRDRLSQQVSGLERQLIQLKAGVQQELDDGGYRLGPVKSRLQEMLADFSTSPRSLTTQQLQQASQPPLPRQQGSSPVPAPPPTPPNTDKQMMI